MGARGDVDLGFVGVGSMGSRMVARLIAAGYSVAVHDSSSEAVERMVRLGASVCTSPQAVADVAPIVLVSLPAPADVRAVACGPDGLVRGSAMRTYVDLSTTGPVVAEEIAAVLGEAGIACIDAPVSGGTTGAEAGSLTIMVSGDEGAIEESRSVLGVLGTNVVFVGSQPGQGQLAKLLNNLLSAAAIAITAEALTLGVKGGLAPGLLLDLFNASSGRNTATADKFPKQVLPRTFDAGFRLKLMAKDVQLCLAESQRREAPMILGGTVEKLWSLAAAHADEGDDCTAIVKLFEDWSGTVIADETAS